ncbi:MAG: DinB family protein [Chitinophagaceae bacterium]|nr:DinB family protein [Chitinophagaceae bacterium]
MKQLLQQYAAYNIWANKKISDVVSQLSEEQIHQEIVSSFPSVYKTMLHLMEVENAWWERLKLVEHPAMSGWFTGNFADLIKKWMELSLQWEAWIRQTNDVNIMHVFAYQNSKKEHFKQPVYEMLLHLFNHQTFHRGQLITMLRQLGIEKIPPTDFIVFSRSWKG